jgi:hypothetical protein
MKKYPVLRLLRKVVVLSLAPTRALIVRSGDEQEIKRVFKQLIDAEEKAAQADRICQPARLPVLRFLALFVVMIKDI